MSSQYLNQAVPNSNVNIRINDAVVTGELSVVENSSFSGKLTVGGYVQSGSLLLNGSGEIRLPALTTYTQVGTETSPMTISGAEEQFIIKTSSTGTINPSTTRLFNVNHSGVIAQKTMILLSRTSSLGGSPQLLNWVAYTDNGIIRIARHNLSTIPETGFEEIIVKLIQ
tara:strand:+ start:5632 stop:6138 length:507 start_codon:yes stop_codon:yes gene_type:complete